MSKFLFTSLILLLPVGFGRSPFISAFNPYLKSHIDLSEKWLALAFTIGNLIASFSVPFFIFFLGKNFKLTTGFRLAYGVFIVGFLSFVVAMSMRYCAILSFLGLVIGYMGLRLSGQSLLPTLGRSYSALIFNDKQCAWVASWHSLVQIIGALILYLLAQINAFDYWHWILSAQILILIIFIIFTPKDLLRVPSIETNSTGKFWVVFKDFPLVFKYGVILIGLQNLHATAALFHLSDFAREQAVPLTKIFKVFLPISLLTFICNPVIAGMYAYVKIHVLFVWLWVNLILANSSLLCLKNNYGIGLFIFSNALGWSLNRILSYSFPIYALSEQQRAIGYATLAGLASFCSALGPFIYSCLFLLAGQHLTVIRWMLLFNGIILIGLLTLLAKKHASYF